MNRAKNSMDELILKYPVYPQLPMLMDYYSTVNDFYCSVVSLAITLARTPENTYEELDYVCMSYFDHYSYIGSKQMSGIGYTFEK